MTGTTDIILFSLNRIKCMPELKFGLHFPQMSIFLLVERKTLVSNVIDKNIDKLYLPLVNRI